MTPQNTDPVYLDHAATTPMRPEAIAAMASELGHLGNPSSLHAAGRRARRVVEESREQLAEVFGARPSEVIFTSGGTEADNLAVKGLYWARHDGARRRVLTTSVEHHAILDSVRWLEEAQGAEATWLAVGDDGMVLPGALRAAIAQAPEQVAMVSVMWANNEVGAVQPVGELAAVAHEYGVPFHTDAVQAAAQLPVDFAASGADALTVSGHKLGGPVGVGALILARGAAPVPVLHGGGQERDIRSGTLDTPAIRAFAVAAEACARQRADEAERLAALRDDLVRQVLAAVPDAVLNGPPPGPGRLPGNAHFSFPGCEGDALLMLLDANGIACSTGSACTAGVAEPSHVLLAMGADDSRARGSLRFSLGHTSTKRDVDALGLVIREVVDRARRAAPATPLTRLTRDEDPLPARAVRRVAHVGQHVAARPERVLDLGSRPEPPGGVRRQRRPVRGEDVGAPVAHQGAVHLGQVPPGLDPASAGDLEATVGTLAIPPQPRLARRVPDLEHQVTARAERGVDAAQRRGPVLVGQEHVGDVGGHRGQVHLELRQAGRVAVQPPHPLRPRLGPGHVERRRRGIHPGDVQALAGRPAGEGARTAADVQQAARPELGRYRQVVIEIAAFPLNQVIDRRQPRLTEEGIRHAPIVENDCARSRASR